MKKFLGRLLIVVLLAVIGVFLTLNLIARKSVEVAVTKVTGFPLQIGALQLKLFKSTVAVHDIKLLNPPSFPDRLFADLPRLEVDYQLSSMLRRAPHINNILIDINQIVLIKDKQGDSNAIKLKSAVSSGNSSSHSTKYQIDTLHLHVGTVTVKDYSRATPSERNISLNINATYNNVTDSTDITRLVLLTVMTRVRLPDLGIKPEDLTKNLGNVQNAAGNVIKGASGVIEKTGQGLFDSLKQIVPQK